MTMSVSPQSSSRLKTPQDDSHSSSLDPPSEAIPLNRESKGPTITALLDGHGPSMFDENQTLDVRNPQTLSAAPAPVIQQLVDHHGAVSLVKRLSTALAQRDAHITALLRLTEEFKISKDLVNEAASKAKQLEETRLSLAVAIKDERPSNGTSTNGRVRVRRV